MKTDDFYYKYVKYKSKYLSMKSNMAMNTADYYKYMLIGVGDFSHGDNNVWEFRLKMLRKFVREAKKPIVIFIEDTEEHTSRIVNDGKLVIGKKYGVTEGKYPYGPLERYCYRAWDSPIYLKIMKYIRLHKIMIVGVDVPTQARDKTMAQTILKSLNKNNINLFWAANAHIDARQITEEYELKWVPEEKYRCGYYLREELGDDYCIMLSTGYEGKIRFSSICDNKSCDKRTFPTVPIFEKVKHAEYEKYVTGNEYDVYEQFDDNKIVEYADARFPDGKFVIKTNTWDYLIFFSRIDKLELMGV